MIHPNSLANATVRSVFIIDPKHVVRTTLTYPASTGRNSRRSAQVDRFAATHRVSQPVATPGNWKNGDDVVIVPSLRDPELIKQKFTKVTGRCAPTSAR
jgi:alkyl hydroperoxide reductase subunit AhpC